MVGRSHGFAELNGVPFKLAEKYDVKHSSFMRMLENLHISTVAGALAEADAYTFDLERRVLENMEQKGS